MATPDRVLGWDVLRGLCALAVATYHLLVWQDVAALHTFGSYGVYLFFVLSGASLAYTYADRIGQGSFSLRRFLWVRYLRLAPLYLLLMLVVLPWKLLKEGPGAALLEKIALNATFLFGFFDPAVQAMLVGGWSLGIEAIFYLLFPVMVLAGLRGAMGLVLLALLLVLQVSWVHWTAGGAAGYAANAVLYHQAPAFAAYFMGGCLLGLAQRRGRVAALSSAACATLVVAGFGLMLLLNPAQQGQELLGWRGLLLCGMCFLMVWLAGGVHLQDRAARFAASLGDATYGVYLIHPVVFFGLVFVVLPALGMPGPARWPLALRLLLALAVLASVFVLALLSERNFERPLRQWSKSGR